MKILIYKWNVFNQEDIKSAFEQFGHIVDMYSCPSGKQMISEVEGIDQKITESDVKRIFPKNEVCDVFKEYDIIFSVNYFSEVSDLCEELKKPYVSWTVDSPMITMYHSSIFHKHNYIFVFDQFQYVQFKNMGVKHVYYLPLAVDTKRVQKQLAERKNLAENHGHSFQNEIAFVGGLYHKNSYDAIESVLPDYLRGYFDAAMEAQMDIYGDNLFDSLLNVDILTKLSDLVDFQQDDRSFSDLKLVFTSTYLGYKLAQKERIRYLNNLAKNHQLGLYTSEPDQLLQNVTYRGTVDYLKDMPSVFHDSNINLNLTIRNIRTGIPLRVWDVLGAGGFLLTNYQLELDTYFENGKDIVYFDGMDDCLRKADYYLSHEDERMAIAANGLQKVREGHSYEDRIGVILDCIKNAKKQ